jgi:signal transduction histidine kinase
MTIQDNGVGFACDDHDGYGLRNMRDRARLLGGQLEVTSASGQGTTLTLDIPWSDQR